MRRAGVYIAMSLDGYIADGKGGVGSEPGSTGSYEAFIRTVDTVVMGYRTYDQICTGLSPGR